MPLLEKIQKLPKRKRKIILWSFLVIIGLCFFVWWIRAVQKKIQSFEKENLKEKFQIPALEEKLKEVSKIEIPEIKMPEINKEEFGKMEEEVTKKESKE